MTSCVPEELPADRTVVGVKQVRRALSRGEAKLVLLAEDADPALIFPLRSLCEESGVRVEAVASMRRLGEACGISVRAAAAALV